MSFKIVNPVVTQLASDAHRIYVKKLYRTSLRTAADWYWRREECREKQMMIRRLFEANLNKTNVKEVETLLGTTEYLLAAYANPAPIIPVDSPGGTRFERNYPFPEEMAHAGVTPFDNYSD